MSLRTDSVNPHFIVDRVPGKSNTIVQTTRYSKHRQSKGGGPLTRQKCLNNGAKRIRVLQGTILFSPNCRTRNSSERSWSGRRSTCRGLSHSFSIYDDIARLGQYDPRNHGSTQAGCRISHPDPAFLMLCRSKRRFVSLSDSRQHTIPRLRGHTMSDTNGVKDPADFMNTWTEASADDVDAEACAPCLRRGILHPHSHRALALL